MFSMWQNIILLINKNLQSSTEAGGAQSLPLIPDKVVISPWRRRSKSHVHLGRGGKHIWAWNLVLIQSRELLPL